MDRYYIRIHSTNKAKNDLDELMERSGWSNVGSRKCFSGRGDRFLTKLWVVLRLPFRLRRDGILLIQYPFKKYYTCLCRMAHFRRCKVVVLIHDLGSFRRRRLTVDHEIRRLNRSDYVIVHNPAMEEWLKKRGCRVPLGDLEIFDYLSVTRAVEEFPLSSLPKVIYAGALGPRKNAFLYELDGHISSYELEVYGKGLEERTAANWKHIFYKGFMPSDGLIASNRGHFGLVWDGDSLAACDGNWGEYLKYNNPHKTSFYIRCHLPVIIWSRAALAPFVRENRIGICVESLYELNRCLHSLGAEEYAEMRKNVIAMSERLSSGYYFYKAVEKAMAEIKKN